MKPLAMLALLLVALSPILACGSDDDDDCEIAKTDLNVRRTQKLGESCTVAFYGTCKEPFTSCAEGTCEARPGDGKKSCTTSCNATSDCRSGTSCIGGHCHAPIDCKTTCDGATCCTYAVDPADPTQCKQISCTKT